MRDLRLFNIFNTPYYNYSYLIYTVLSLALRLKDPTESEEFFEILMIGRSTKDQKNDQAKRKKKNLRRGIKNAASQKRKTLVSVRARESKGVNAR
jgi:hypothetical protein